MTRTHVLALTAAASLTGMAAFSQNAIFIGQSRSPPPNNWSSGLRGAA